MAAILIPHNEQEQVNTARSCAHDREAPPDRRDPRQKEFSILVPRMTDQQSQDLEVIGGLGPDQGRSFEIPVLQELRTQWPVMRRDW